MANRTAPALAILMLALTGCASKKVDLPPEPIGTPVKWSAGTCTSV